MKGAGQGAPPGVWPSARLVSDPRRVCLDCAPVVAVVGTSDLVEKELSSCSRRAVEFACRRSSSAPATPCCRRKRR